MHEKTFKATLWHEHFMEVYWTKMWVWPEAVLSLPQCCMASRLSASASSPAFRSQLSHSSAQNSPVASISLQGKAKALHGPPKLWVLWPPGPPRPHLRPQRAHTDQAACNSLLLLEPARSFAVRASDLALPLPVMYFTHTCMAHAFTSSGLFLNVTFSVMTYLNTIFPHSPDSFSLLHSYLEQLSPLTYYI